MVDAPLSNDERPDTYTQYRIECYCATCRCHYNISATFDSLEGCGNICNLSDETNVLHHFRLVESMNADEYRNSVGDAAYRYEPLSELHRFVCTAAECPANLEIRISLPRLSKKLLGLIMDTAKLYQRGSAQIWKEPERYAGQQPATVLEALGYLRQYLMDAKAVQDPTEIKRIAKRNKKYMLAFANVR